MLHKSNSPKPVELHFSQDDFKNFMAMANLSREYGLDHSHMEAMEAWVCHSHFPTQYELLQKLSELPGAKKILKERKFALSLVGLMDLIQVFLDLDEGIDPAKTFDDPLSKHAES